METSPHMKSHSNLASSICCSIYLIQRSFKGLYAMHKYTGLETPSICLFRREKMWIICSTTALEMWIFLSVGLCPVVIILPNNQPALNLKCSRPSSADLRWHTVVFIKVSTLWQSFSVTSPFRHTRTDLHVEAVSAPHVRSLGCKLNCSQIFLCGEGMP